MLVSSRLLDDAVRNMTNGRPKHIGRRSRASTKFIAVLAISGFAISSYSYFVIRDSQQPQHVSSVAKQVVVLPSPTSPAVLPVKPTFNNVNYRSYPSVGDRIGTITFPTLDLSWPIIQGTDKPQLAQGVGHYLKSVLPGQIDNTVLAGHRETVFNRLGELSIGDEVAIETAAGTFRYKVRQFRIVDRDDRTVIVPTETAVLTLATCYPFNFVGITHQSFIVVADLIGATYEQ